MQLLIFIIFSTCLMLKLLFILTMIGEGIFAKVGAVEAYRN
jgi:hypothetical protein